MKFLILFLLISTLSYGQTTYYIRADSTRLQKVGGNNELIIENATKATTGVLVNYGNGRTRFSKPRINGDTLFVGVDTILGVGSGGGSTYYNSNIGAGYRLAIPNTNNIKTLFAGTNVVIDSNTNANGLTITASGGGSYTLAADSLTGWALQFDLNKGHNVYHGYFWLDSSLKFMNESWIVPEVYSTGWTGYYISAGYGGAHMLLAGVATSATQFSVTGNIYPGSGTLADYTFEGWDLLPINTLHHVGIIYNGTKIVVFVDGVPSGYKNFTGYRTASGGSEPMWYSGGSDHSNFNGKILRIRHFEDDVPIQSNQFFYPKWVFDGYMPNIVLNTDYTKPSNIIEDYSPGFLGVKHPGVRNSIAPMEKPFAGVINSVNTAIDGRADSLLPQWTKYNFEKPVYTGGAPVIPGSAIIYDEFSRADITPAFSLTLELDSTEGGTAGKKKYTVASPGSGIIGGAAWMNTGDGVYRNYATVDAGTASQDIYVTAGANTLQKFVLIRGKYTDDNNHVLLTAEGGTTYLYKAVAGVFTLLGSYATGSFTTMRLDINGDTCDVYEDATLKISAADISAVPSGTLCGFGVTTNYSRVTKWEVY